MDAYSTPKRRPRTEIVTPEKTAPRVPEPELAEAALAPSPEYDATYDPPHAIARFGSRFLVGYSYEILRDAPPGYHYDPRVEEYYIRPSVDAAPFAAWLPRPSASASVGVYFLDVAFDMKDEAKRNVSRRVHVLRPPAPL